MPKRFVIDAHQHWRSTPDYVPTLVKTYRARNAMACVLTRIESLDQMIAAAKQHPDVIIPYGHLDVDHPAARAHIETFAKAGVKGIKMHTPKNNWDDFGYFPLYARMQELGIVALFHTGIVSGNGSGEPEQSSMARMRPSFLHTIARSFPTLKIHGSHLGNPWYDEAAEAARWSPNLYFDVTGSTLQKKQHNLTVFREYLWWDGPAEHSPSIGGVRLREARVRHRRVARGARQRAREVRGDARGQQGARGEPQEDLRRDDGSPARHHGAPLNRDRSQESGRVG